MVMVYLRLDSESTDFVIRTYDLDGIIRAAVRPFAGEFIGRRLQLHYEPLDYRAVTDEKWLGFVIGQLLSNALKYTKKGKISIYMRAEEPHTLVIQDTGIGIPAEDQDRVFERFYRVDKSHSKEIGGTGLGLSIVKHAVSTLQGKIILRSEEGSGTEIIMRFLKTHKEQ